MSKDGEMGSCGWIGEDLEKESCSRGEQKREHFGGAVGWR